MLGLRRLAQKCPVEFTCNVERRVNALIVTAAESLDQVQEGVTKSDWQTAPLRLAFMSVS